MDAAKQTREDAIAAGHQDPILRQVSWLLVPFIFLFAIYVLLHGEESPGDHGSCRRGGSYRRNLLRRR